MEIQFGICLLVVMCHLILGSEGKRGDESKYTKKEEEALLSLRKLITSELYADYMHRDEYLIPWLRNRDLDPVRANEFLRSNLKWRKEEKIDDLPNEAFPQFENTFQYDLKAHDKEGRPVVLFPFSSWDPRKAGLSGQMDKLIRYFIKIIYEIPQIKARKEGQADGTNATQFIVIVDLNGYNLRQHACVRCLEFPFAYIRNYEAHYPQGAAETLAINTPAIFDPIIQMTKSLFSKQFTETLKLLGPDKSSWKTYLDNIISPDQLPKRFGGTSPRKL